MLSLARAAAYAAAALVVGFGATLNGAADAFETDTSVASVPAYVEHGLAVPQDSGSFEIPLGQSYDPNLSHQVVEHAVDTVDAAPLREGKSLAELVSAYAHHDPDNAELECLAGAVYFESKGEPLQGQLAVAEVILNRASSGKYPRSICGVVTQKSQFSFVRGGRIPAVPRNSDAWRKAVAIAKIAKQDLAETQIGDAMFFHARYVSPRWRLTRVASIGNHIFYR